jgi:hypothetical protein
MSLKKFGVDRLYYFSRIENFESIAKNGIRCKNSLVEGTYSSFADKDVQELRGNKAFISSKKRRRHVHDCVPLYMTTKTPAQYKVHEQENNFFFLVFDSELILDKRIEFAFTDGNAACADTKFYFELQNLSKLYYEVIKARYWNDYVDGKRKKCSEVLINGRVSFENVKEIIVNNTGLRDKIIKILKKNNIHKPVSINSECFFKKNSNYINFNSTIPNNESFFG